MHFVMKLSKLCNLRCNYCYEYEELSHKERMPLEGLDFFFRHLVTYIQSKPKQIGIPHFILHGGEALLLPHSYLRSFRELQRKHLDAAGIEYTNGVQSNLVQISDATLDLLQELNISLGISFDVFGNQRVDIKGRDTQDRVLDNLQRLIDRNIRFGGAITVLHGANIEHVLRIYDFYNRLRINYRMLPIFSHVDPPARIEPILISHQETLTAFQEVAKAQFANPSNIRVLPLWDYFKAAVSYLTGGRKAIYDPQVEEWVYIVNTNGDTYDHGDAYSPEGFMGNIFKQPLSEIRKAPEYQNTVAIRQSRLETCHSCSFYGHCNQLPIAEAISSERVYDENGKLECTIAKPMIQFMINEIEQSDSGKLLLNSLDITHDSSLENQMIPS
ncbi:Radical SAM domain protein [Cyanobacterium stanieri PCC 7202]|uniref:Radical SAM domain protein n=1 Tax=Cyanobacterium stanieri (strain ATCC 29140 / PCC 7202) TaxID=292563 RepID=K9YIG3_CYASC|nr:Radical SAM domain protein [Cyanobacterium stanieri PCC 7202]